MTNHLERLERDGYTIVEDVFDAAFADALLADLARLERTLSVAPGKNLFEGFQTVRIYNLLVHGTLYEAIPMHERVLPIVEGVLDRGCLVSSLSSIAIGPGEGAQPIHADDMLIPLPKPHVPLVCNTMWALTDFTERTAPRASSPARTGADEPRARRGRTTARSRRRCRSGSVLVFNGSLWHGGGANRTRRPPRGHRHELLRGLDPPAGEPAARHPARDRRSGFSPRLRKLVGYGIYHGLLGHIDKCSPVDLLDETRPRRILGE